MARVYAFHISSRLAASQERVWAHASSMAGVNQELGPLLQMTYPPAFATLTAGNLPLGQRLFRSWILFVGAIPIEYDDLTIVQFQPEQSFVERSRMLAMKLWQHQRNVHQLAEGCCVTDIIRFCPRLAVSGPLLHAIFLLVFKHRHRRLRRLFGA